MFIKMLIIIILTKKIKYDDDESLEQKQETYNRLFDEKLDEIQELIEKLTTKT